MLRIVQRRTESELTCPVQTIDLGDFESCFRVISANAIDSVLSIPQELVVDRRKAMNKALVSQYDGYPLNALPSTISF